MKNLGIDSKAIQPVLGLKLKIIGRVFNTCGIFVSAILLAFIALALFLVYKSDSQYVSLGVASVLMLVYNEMRKDREFLRMTFNNPYFLVAMDYIMIGVPFILISLLKGEYWQIAVMIAVALLLPCIKRHDSKQIFCIRLPFLYRGGIDMIYAFRVSWWLFPLALAGVIIGMVYDNINLAKVCTILWTLFFSASMRNPVPLVMNYRGFWRFFSENMKMVLFDTTIFLLPLLVVLAFCGEGVQFPMRLLVSGIMLASSFVFVRYIVDNFILLFVNVFIMIVIYGISLFNVYGYAMSVVLICLYLFFINTKYCRLWN